MNEHFFIQYIVLKSEWPGTDIQSIRPHCTDSIYYLALFMERNMPPAVRQSEPPPQTRSNVKKLSTADPGRIIRWAREAMREAVPVSSATMASMHFLSSAEVSLSSIVLRAAQSEDSIMVLAPSAMVLLHVPVTLQMSTPSSFFSAFAHSPPSAPIIFITSGLHAHFIMPPDCVVMFSRCVLQ